MVALVLIVVVGLAVSAGGATFWYNSVQNDSKASFNASSSAVSSSLSTALRRDYDFVAAQAAMFTAFPGMTNAQYGSWYDSMDVSNRYSGGVGFAFVQKVPQAEIPYFASAVAADPVRNVAEPPPGQFTPLPPGDRPYYCFARTGVYSATVQFGAPASFDFCAPLVTGLGSSPFPPAMYASMNSGLVSVAPPIKQYPEVFFVVAPVYRSGASLGTVAARQAAISGWVVGTFNGKSIIESTLAGTTNVAVSLFHQSPGAQPELIAKGGKAPTAGAYSRTTSIRNGGIWLMTVRGSASTNALVQGVGAGLLGLIITLLLGAFVAVLGRSREQALVLVDRRTGELRYQALHDDLTGLPNRALIIDRTEQMLARTRRQPAAVGALFIDLDNFKDINDSFGHQVGDRLLEAVATRLEEAVRESDTVGRLGGDEFVILVEGSSLDAGPEVIAERILGIIREPFSLEEAKQVSLTVRASLGVAVGVRPAADDLLRDADVALYEAKRAGRNRYAIFRPEMQTAVQDRMALELDLHDALDENQLYLVYLPTFDLHEMKATGVEALLRWRHPTRGVLKPTEFIPLADETGMIVPIGRFVLNQVCQQAAAWRQKGLDIPVSVNVSARQLESTGFVEDVRRALTASGIEPGSLTLEVTESVLMHNAETTSQRLRALKELGTRIAIDDFGTGYSSLAYLRRFPVDALKIDRSFISGLSRSTQSGALIHTLIQLGKTLGIDTLGEGIEEQSQLTQLQREQCDEGQGYLFSRPLEADAVEQFIAASSAVGSSIGATSAE